MQHGVDRDLGIGVRHAVEDAALLFNRWIADLELKHETVDLGLGQGIGAFLLDRVFGGHYEEWCGEFMGFIADGDLPLLHGFKQRALHLGGRAVDFVG